LLQVVWVAIAAKAVAAGGLFLNFYVIGEVGHAGETLDAAEVDEMVRLGWPVVIMGLSTWFLSLGDRLVIGWFRDAQQVGVYAAAYALAGLIGAVGAPFWSPLYPLMAAHYRDANRPALVAASRRFTSSYFTIGIPMVAGLTLFSAPALTLFGSHEFTIGRFAFLAIALGLLADQTTAVASYIFYLEKESRRLRNIAVMSAVVNLALNVALVPTFGIAGAACATLLAYGLMAAALWTVIRRHGYGLGDLYDLGWMLRVVLSSFVMTAALLVFGVDRVTIAGLLGRSALGAGMYAVVLAAVGGWRRLEALTSRRPEVER
jgi:O-antigen/teichoic acid export membrane protein